MSLSKEDRHNDILQALTFMRHELGDQGIGQVAFEIDRAPYEDIKRTTWQYLEDSGYIVREDTLEAGRCKFTASGWLYMLNMLEQVRSPELAAKVGRVMAALKKEVKGRHEKGFVFAESAAADARVSWGLVFNIIESKFIEHCFARKGATWDRKGRGTLIVVPVDFGEELL
jgi:hypothetical protein